MNKARLYLAMALLAALTAFAYLPSLDNGFLNYDDSVYVTHNPHVKNGSTADLLKILFSFQAGHYHPLTSLSFAAEYRIFGAAPRAFHLDNLCLHLINVFLVLWLLMLLGTRFNAPKPHVAAFCAAALFAIHPLNSESVLWISERKNLLYAAFFLSGLIGYVKYVATSEKRFLRFAFIFFAASLLSKAMAVTFPVILMLFDYFLGRKQRVIEKIPFFVLSVVFSALAVMGQHSAGALRETTAFNFTGHAMVVSKALVFYLQKIFMPSGFSVYYPWPAQTGAFMPLSYLLSPAAAACLAAGALHFMRKIPEVSFGLLFYAAAILPALQIVPAGLSPFADHAAYAPSIGVFYILGAGLAEAVAADSALTRRSASFLTAGVLVLLALLTRARAPVWRDDVSLWSDALEKYPSAEPAYMNRGTAYFAKTDYGKALGDFDAAIRIAPSSAEARDMKGGVYSRNSEWEKAVLNYDAAIRINPGYAEAYRNRALARLHLGDGVNALKDSKTAVRLQPGFWANYYTEAVVCTATGAYENAERNYLHAVRLNANAFQPFSGLGAVHALLGEYGDAARDYLRALQIEPSDPDMRNNLANVFILAGRQSAAAEQYEKALEINPLLFSARANLAAAYLSLGQCGRAKKQLDELSRLGQEVPPGLLKGMASTCR